MSSDEVNNVPKLPIADFASKHKEIEKEKKVIKIQKEVINYNKQRELKDKDFHEVDMFPDYLGQTKREGASFRLSNHALLLTYEGCLDKENLINFVKSKSKKPVSFIRCAHEPPTEHIPVDHTHVVVKWDKIFQSTSESIFDHDGKSPWIRKLNPGKGAGNTYDKAVRYLSRSDPENIDLDNVGNSFATMIWNCEDLTDALSHAKTPNDVAGIIALYSSKPIKTFPLRFRELGGDKWDSNEMQSYIFTKLLEVNDPNYDPDEGNANRKIIWIYNRKGSSGKSVICTDIFRAKLAHIIPNGGGGSANVAQNLRGAMEKGWNGRAVFFDFARNLDKADKDYLYEILEMVKNGLLNCSKYESCTLDLGGSPLIVIMANFLPRLVNKDTLEPTMSFDKWNVKIMANNTGSQGCFDEVATAKFAQKISVESIKYDKRQLVEDDNDDEEERAQKKALKASGKIDATDKFMQNYNKIIEKKILI